MNGMDFMQEAQDYSRVIDDLKHILKGNPGDKQATFHSQGNLKKRISPRIQTTHNISRFNETRVQNRTATNVEQNYAH